MIQILCETGLLPGALLHNNNQKFICKNVNLSVQTTGALITNRMKVDQNILIPIAHGEGRYYADEATLSDLNKNDQVIFKYCDDNKMPLLDLKDFSSKDFAKYHPGGTLGRKLYLRVHELAANNEAPKVEKHAPVKDVIVEISKKRLGTTAVVENDMIIGIITDGDIRRMLEKTADISTLEAKDIMSANPISVSSDTMAVNALDIMQKNNITQILVTEHGKYSGVVHFHDLLKEGII